MRILNPIDAITPAFARTKLVLFSPFRMGRTWKLCATGYLAFGSTVFFPFPLFYLVFIPAFRGSRPGIVTLIVVGVSALTTACLIFFYLSSRLQFAFFDIVLNCDEFVAPAWRRYGRQTWPWLWFKLAFGVVCTLLVAAPFAGAVLHLVRSFEAMKVSQQPDPSIFFTMMGLEFGALFGFAALFLFGSLLTDFILPSLALESTTLAEAFRRVGKLIRFEPGQFFGYVGMKIVLGLAGYIGQMICVYIVLFVVIVVCLIIGAIGYFVLHALGVGSTVMAVLAIVAGAAIYFATMTYFVFGTAGIVLTFLQSYALYFLGGRYPILGTLLEQSALLTPPAPMREVPAPAVPPFA